MSAHAVTYTADRFDVATSAPEFLAQSLHVCVDGPSGHFRLVSPYIREQPLSCLHTSATFVKCRQQSEFEGR